MSKLTDVVRNFREVARKQRSAESLAFEMLRHPDALPEHIQSAREIAMNIDRMMVEMVTSLRRVFPDRQLSMPFQWNKSEYDRFYKPQGE